MTYEVIELAEANRRLASLVVGDGITQFETGCVWTLTLQEEGRTISFQRMSSTKEARIIQALDAADSELFDRVESEEIIWATLLASVTRRTIVGAVVDDQATLKLTFEGGTEIVLETDVDIVDWQWCISTNSPEPYHGEAELVCFWRSEISGCHLSKVG